MNHGLHPVAMITIMAMMRSLMRGGEGEVPCSRVGVSDREVRGKVFPPIVRAGLSGWIVHGQQM